MGTVDYTSEFDELYRQDREPSLVEVPPLSYLMVDGRGDPNTGAEYTDAVETVRQAAAAVRALAADRLDREWAPMPLEALWWATEGTVFETADRADWRFSTLVMQPDAVDDALVADALSGLRERMSLPALERARLGTLEEGTAAQVLHVGPYDAEAPTVDRLHAFIEDEGYVADGKHHEIYVDDPNRTDAGELETIIRQPVSKG